MLSILPLMVLVGLVLYFFAAVHRQDNEHRTPWQGSLLLAAAAWGVLLLFISEGLSLFAGITMMNLAVVWSIALICVIFLLVRNAQPRELWLRFRNSLGNLSRFEVGLLVFIGLMLLMLLAVGLVTPPNMVDVMNYHMPRVMHWAQEHRITHFATPQPSQNSKPYWAELVILNLRVLAGSDRPAAMIAWLSMLGCMILVTGIVNELGGDRRSKWLGLSVSFAIPVALLQATTPKNDITSAFWVLALAYYTLLDRRRPLAKSESIGLGLVLGLGMLTKGTFFPYAFGIMLWYFLHRLFSRGFVRTAIHGLLVAAIALLLAAPFLARNFRTYGSPFGNFVPVEVPEVESRSPHPDAGGEIAGQGVGGGVYLSSRLGGLPETPDRVVVQPITASSGLLARALEQARRLVRMVLMNFVSPFAWFNQRFFSLLESWPVLYPTGNLEPLEQAAWNHALTAGNPVHMFLIPLLAIPVAVWALRGRHRLWGEYLLFSALGFLAISFVSCADGVFCLRYQLPFVALMSALIAVVLPVLGWRVVQGASVFFVLYAAPYVLINNMRPVIGLPPWPTRTESVFSVRPVDLLFASRPEVEDEYVLIADAIRTSRCDAVGLMLYRFDLEYPIWWLLDAPQSDVRIENLQTTPDSAIYIDKDFKPCAIVCTRGVCLGREQMRGLPLAISSGHVRLFLRQE